MALSESAVSELLEALRAGQAVDLIRESVKMVLQELVEAEAIDVVCAARYERTDTRTNEPNGAPGMRLTLCPKVMGRRRRDGLVEPLVRLAEVEVVSVGREPLALFSSADVTREGFPGWDPDQFIRFFCQPIHRQPE
jgi:Transposase, Mutator family